MADLDLDLQCKKLHKYAGVQSINDVFHIVVKVENVFDYTHIFNLIDNVEYVVYALYSRVCKRKFIKPIFETLKKVNVVN